MTAWVRTPQLARKHVYGRTSYGCHSLAPEFTFMLNDDWRVRAVPTPLVWGNKSPSGPIQCAAEHLALCRRAVHAYHLTDRLSAAWLTGRIGADVDTNQRLCGAALDRSRRITSVPPIVARKPFTSPYRIQGQVHNSGKQ
jgi:hypothetical protein